MNRIQVAVIAGVALAFAAGGSVGMLIRSDRPGRPEGKEERGGGLTRDLDLTPEQQAQMKEIWSKVMTPEGMQQSRQRRQELQQRRDDAIQAMLTDEQRARYREIFAEHEEATEEMYRERSRRVDEAVERTKAIFTETQRQKYEEIRKNRHRGSFRGNRGSGSFRYGGSSGPRTRKAPQEPSDVPPPGDSPGGEIKSGQDRPETPAGRIDDLSPGSERLLYACLDVPGRRNME